MIKEGYIKIKYHSDHDDHGNLIEGYMYEGKDGSLYYIDDEPDNLKIVTKNQIFKKQLEKIKKASCLL